jgi:hypothetical protein
MVEQVESVRREEAPVRAALRKAHDSSAGAEQEEEVSLRESRLKSAEHAPAAELAEDNRGRSPTRSRPSRGVQGVLLERLDAKAATLRGDYWARLAGAVRRGTTAPRGAAPSFAWMSA